MTDAAVLAELGRRLTRHRLARNWTQAQTAARAGVGQATVQRAERGESVQMTSMVKLLRTLELLEGLDAAIPESIDLPIAQLTRERRGARRRARSGPRDRPNLAPQRWTWRDEAQDPVHPQPPDSAEANSTEDRSRDTEDLARTRGDRPGHQSDRLP